jgi:hypothetical protein
VLRKHSYYTAIEIKILRRVAPQNDRIGKTLAITEYSDLKTVTKVDKAVALC